MGVFNSGLGKPTFRVYALFRTQMAVTSNLAMRRLADQILVDAIRASSKISPADIPKPIGFAPSIRFKKAPRKLRSGDSRNRAGRNHQQSLPQQRHGVGPELYPTPSVSPFPASSG